MVILFLLVVVVSGVAGLAMRRIVSAAVGRALLVLGAGALVAGIGALVLMVTGWLPLSMWTAGLAALVSLAVAALVLPFACAVRLGRA